MEKISLPEKIKNKSIIFGLSSSEEIAKKVAKLSGIEYGDRTIKTFADKEIFIEINSSVRSKNVFIIQSTSTPANDYLMELLIFLDAVKRASAEEVTVIMPYFGYARQDRKTKGRQPISAKLVADLITVAGSSRIISFDIHSDQTQGFFNIPFDNLKAQGPLSQFFKKEFKINNKDLVIVSPDHGGVSRARAFAKRFHAPLAIIDKRRIDNGKVELNYLLGNVEGKEAIILDDIVDTAGTMSEAIKFLKKSGAKNVYSIFTHPVLSGTASEPDAALKKMVNAGVKALVTTNTISRIPKSPYLKVVDLSNVISDVIKLHLTNHSISEYFDNTWK